jgi:hypothetical protein
MAAVVSLKPKTSTEKITRTTVDTIMVTPVIVNKWVSPPFQRPVRENEKVRALAEKLKGDGGVWPGIVTLGVLGSTTYLLDGQHRRTAFLMSGIDEGYTDVRIHYCSTMAEMGEEFVSLNSQLVRLRPDDILRGLEESVPLLKEIRAKCPYVGYDMIRRGQSAPLLSMSSLLRCWKGSQPEVPTTRGHGLSAHQLAQTFGDEDGKNLTDFLAVALEAFGRDEEYQRLWGSLNLVLCMWLYRRTVMAQHSTKTPKLSKQSFCRCLMSLSANSQYLDWLVGRTIGERDRSPAYSRIKSSFAERIKIETGSKAMLPQPAWAHHQSGGKG